MFVEKLTTEVTMISDQERLDGFFAILEETKKMTEQASYLPGVQERSNLLANGFTIVSPRLTKDSRLGFTPIWASSPNIYKERLRIYPRFSQDEKLHSALNNDTMSRYGSHTRLYHQINLGVLSETRRYMAYVLIHELGHAIIAEQRRLIMTEYIYSLAENITEEAEMRTFDYQLLLAIGGSEYQIAVDKALYWIQKERRAHKPGQKPLTPFDMGHCLDLIFGQPIPENKSKRNSLFELLCCMMDADRSFPMPIATNLKNQLIKNYYHEKWL